MVAGIAGMGGFLLGKARSPSDPAQPSQTVSEQGGNLPGGVSQGHSMLPVREASASGVSSTGRMNVNVLRRELEIIKRDPNPIKRFASLTHLLGGLSQDNLGTVLDAFDDIPMRYEHRDEYQMLIYAWAAFDPQAALEFVSEKANSRSINKSDLLRPLTASWASNDPGETLEWLNGLPERKRSENLMSGLIQGWATKDPYAAAEYLQANVEPGQHRERLAGEIVSHLFKQDPMQAVKWAEAQHDLAFRGEAFEELAEDWASVNPQGLAEWLGNYVDDEHSVEAFQDLARGWVSRDPDAATAYFEALPDGPAKETGIYEMARTWGRDDLAALGEWLNQLGDSTATDRGVQAYVERLASQSPQAAAESAMSIIDDDLRTEAVQYAGTWWYRRDPDSATAWADANGFAVETFQRGEHFQDIELLRGVDPNVSVRVEAALEDLDKTGDFDFSNLTRALGEKVRGHFLNALKSQDQHATGDVTIDPDPPAPDPPESQNNP